MKFCILGDQGSYLKKEEFFVLRRGTTVMYFTGTVFFLVIREKDYHTSFFHRPLPSLKDPPQYRGSEELGNGLFIF